MATWHLHGFWGFELHSIRLDSKHCNNYQYPQWHRPLLTHLCLPTLSLSVFSSQSQVSWLWLASVGEGTEWAYSFQKSDDSISFKSIWIKELGGAPRFPPQTCGYALFPGDTFWTNHDTLRANVMKDSSRNKSVLLYFLTFAVCCMSMWVYLYEHACYSMSVEMIEQPAWVNSLSPENERRWNHPASTRRLGLVSIRQLGFTFAVICVLCKHMWRSKANLESLFETWSLLWTLPDRIAPEICLSRPPEFWDFKCASTHFFHECWESNSGILACKAAR